TGEEDHPWEEEKATSLQERTNRNRLAILPLIFFFSLTSGIHASLMGWIEVEMIWECSWRR
uniref:Uncharacterized protein n=1 Tax=Theropithecus gelada TaxID=9565 RepID=A0A8D2FH14_THEGE